MVDPLNNDLSSLDPNTRYALDIERSEAFNNELGVRGIERVVFDHATVFVGKPAHLNAFIDLMGTNKKRRWAYFDVPKSNLRVFIFDQPGYSNEQLESCKQRIENVNCKALNVEEQQLREKEKAVLTKFLENQINMKADYDHVKSRILEFLQG